MVERRGQGVRMSDIAAGAGVSRQALYLHFSSRTDLLVETTRYGDKVRDIDQRLVRWRAATSGLDLLEAFIEFWGNYIPEIYGIARALLAARDTDEAAAAAWTDRMAAIRGGCQYIVETLHKESKLVSTWTTAQATDMLWTIVSIRNWEQLTQECGWSNESYVDWLRAITQRILLKTIEQPANPAPNLPDTAKESLSVKPDCF